jgi:peptidoglycan/LPS O-acetylase OafA/YrhL
MKRDARISAIRMICTLAVVVLHITQQLEKIYAPIRYATDWLNLGLVMFFCISAFLYSKREITKVKKWYLHRYLEIAIPSVLVGIATVVVFWAKGSITADKMIGALLSCVGLQVYAPDSWMFVQLWFITYLLFFYLSVPLIQRVKCKETTDFKFWSVLAASIILLQTISIVIESKTGVTLLSVGILLRFYLPYFTFKRYDINGAEIKPIMRLLTVFSVVAVGVICWVRYTPNVGIPSGIAEIMFVYTQTLTGFVLFYWLYRGFAWMKENAVLKIADKYSYEVYLTHCLFIGYSTSLIWNAKNVVLGIVVALAATAVSSVILNIVSAAIKKPIKKYF